MFGSKVKPDSGDDFDFDFDDMNDDFGFDSNEKDDRSPRSKVVRTLKESAEAKSRDARYRRELLKATLPSEYSSVLQDYDTLSKEAGSIFAEQKREWEKQRGAVKKLFKPYTDVLDKIGLKKLSGWANEDERSSGAEQVSDEQLDELKIQGIISETFGTMQADNVKLENARQAKAEETESIAKVDRDIQIKKTIEGNQLLLNINNNMSQMAAYNNNVNFPYQKRSLELAARQLITQQRLLQTMKTFSETAVKELQDIHKNTSLPDYLKITPTEMTQQAIAQRVMGGITAPFDAVGAKVAQKVSNKVKAKMKDFWQFVGDTTSELNFQNEGLAEGGPGGGDGTAWGGLKNIIGGMVGDKVIDYPAEFLKNKIAPKARKLIEEKTGAKLFGTRLKSIGNNFSTMFNESLKRGETGNSLLDMFINVFDLQSEAITGNRTAFDNSRLDLEKAAFMDQRFKLSVTDVIPAWLKKIHHEVYAANNKGEGPTDETWDFKKAGFVSTKSLHDELEDKIVNKENIKNYILAANKWVDTISQQTLTKPTRDWVLKWVMREFNASNSINPLKLLGDEINCPNDIKAELATILPVTLNLNKEQMDLVRRGTMQDLVLAQFKGSEKFNTIMDKSADTHSEMAQANHLNVGVINQISKTPEGQRFLIERGWVTDNGTGGYDINMKRHEQLTDQFYVGRKSNDGKSIRTYARNQDILSADGEDFVGDDKFDLDKDWGEDEVFMHSERFIDVNGLRIQNPGSFYMSKDQKAQKAIIDRVSRMDDPDNKYNPGWGTDYFVDKKGVIHTSVEKDFAEKRKKLRPDIDMELRRKGSYAAGGRIKSFGAGGANLKEGPTKGQPGDEQLVKTHGGEFVVSHDAAKFNVRLLSAINKYGAPLINHDGSINSVYHKTLGFDKAKDMGKELVAGGKGIKNEQIEIAIKNILERLKPSTSIDQAKMIKELTDAKTAPEKRLAKALKYWGDYQREVMKSKGAMNYGKDLASQGLDILNGKFDKWIDTDGTGTNVQIKNSLMAGARAVGKSASKGVKSTASNARAQMLDRDATMSKVSAALREAENPKMFTIPLDLYFKGKGTPFVTKRGFINREYIDKQTGAIIKNPSEITGTIVDKDGNEVVSAGDIITNEVVTGSRKPYKLLGMADANRRFLSATEYSSQTLSLIQQTERYQQMVDKAKQARDKYVMDKPIDIYTRDVADTPRLTAVGFKEGKYIDKNTGSVLWTHHDITGPVVSTTNEELLSQAELDAGLFDSKREHVKISKIKQYRNMAFKRSAEMYKKYGAKHVNKVMDWASKMGEKQVGLNYDNNPIDVYVMGEDEPRIRAADFKAGVVYCDGKVIKSHSGITGPVSMMVTGGMNIVLSKEELSRLADGTGERLKLVGMMGSGERFKNYLKEAIIPTKLRNRLKLLTMTPEKRDELFNDKLAKAKIAYDVYVKGENQTPLLTKTKFEAGEYRSVKTGKVIHIPEQIDGPIIDGTGNQVITEEHLKKGLINFTGDPVSLGGGMIGKFKTGLAIGKRLKGALGGDPNQGLLSAIAEKVGIKGFGKRIGSWEWQRANKKDDKKEDKKEEKKEKKGGWISSLVKKFMGPLGIMFAALSSGLGVVKTALLTGISWLGKSIVTKSLGGGLGSFLSGAMGGGGGKFGGIAKAIVAGAAVYGGIKAYNYLDGKAEGGSTYGSGVNESMSGLDPTTRVLNADRYQQEAIDKSNGGFIDKVTNNPLASGLATAAMMAPGTTWKLAKGAGKLGWAGAKLGGKVLGSVGGGVAKGLGRTALSMAPRLAGGAVNLASKAGTLANIARVAAPAVMSGIGSGVGGALASTLSFLTGPVGLTVMAVGAIAYFGGKALMGLWNDHKNPWNRFRMAQYGFDHNDKGLMEKVAKLEGVATQLVKVNGKGEVSLKSDEKAITEVLKIVGIKDQDGKDIEDQQQRLPNFASWFKFRFVRVFGSYLRTLKRLKGKAEMIDLQTLNRNEQEILLKEVHFTDLTNTPYAVTFSPFEKPKECEMMSKDVDVIARKLKNKISQLPLVKDYVEPQYKDQAKDGIKGQPGTNTDGLEDKQAKNPGKDATPEEKAKFEQDKQLDKEDFNKVGWKDPKTMVDNANKVVRYQADSARIITQQHNKNMLEATEKTAEETDNIFTKVASGLMDKLKNTLSAMSTGFSKIMNGDIIDGAGDLLGATTGTTGNVLFSGAQWIGDMVSGGSKGSEKNLIEAARKSGVTDPTEIAMLLAQASHESGGFKHSRELGNDAYFAKYNNRRDLGNGPNDGARYKGRGWIQVTGRANYAAMSKWAGVDFVSKPELLEKEPYATMATIWYWTQSPNMKNRGRAAAQRGDIVGATKAVNGGTNHLDKRKSAYAKYSQLIAAKGVDGYLATLGDGSSSGGGSAPVAAPVAAKNNAGIPVTLAKPGTNAPSTNVQTKLNQMGMHTAASSAAGGKEVPLMLRNSGTANAPPVVASKTGNASPAPKATKAKPKVFFGDSIADGFKRQHGGDGWTKVGINPKTVLMYLGNTIIKLPSDYRDKDVYLSTGLSNNPTDYDTVGLQLSRLKAVGVKVNVFGVSTTYPKGNASEMNAKLAALCKAYGHKFLGGFVAGKDKVHPASYSSLSGVSSTAAPAKPAAKANVNSTAKVTEIKGKTSNATPTATSAAVKQPVTASTPAAEAMTNGSADWNFSKIAKAAMKNALARSKGQCGKYTRLALMAGDTKQKISKVCGGSLGGHAYQFPTQLKRIGFNPVFQGLKFGNFQPQIGDVAIFDKGTYGENNKSSGGWVSGHACVYTGSKWVSDFVQSSVYPHSKYASSGLMFTVFRADGIAPEGGFDCPAGIGDAQDGYTSGGISNQMSNISNGNVPMNDNGFGGNEYAAHAGKASSFGGGDVSGILNKQLDVQKEILSVLKEMAGKPSNSKDNSQSNNTDANGNPVDANGNPIASNNPNQPMTKPNMGSIDNQPNGKNNSPFAGMKNPISVLKPV